MERCCKYDMDEIDLRILEQLQENSRESLGKIAKDLKVSKATISRRIARLEADGFISRYTVVLNNAKMGSIRGLLLLQVAGPAITSVIAELKKYPEIESVMRVFGQSFDNL